jgi:hypothetical protein
MNVLVGCVTFVDEQYGLRDDEIEPLLPRFSCSSLKQKSLIPDPIKQRNFPAEKANKEWWHSVLGLNTTSSPRFLSWNYSLHLPRLTKTSSELSVLSFRFSRQNEHLRH